MGYLGVEDLGFFVRTFFVLFFSRGWLCLFCIVVLIIPSPLFSLIISFLFIYLVLLGACNDTL
jgi:hypothetical protein